MAGGTLGAVAGRADGEAAAPAAEGPVEVRRRFARSSLTLREGLSAELPDEEAVGKAAGVGLKDLMWFLFFGMPGEEAASLQWVVAGEPRGSEGRKNLWKSKCNVEVFV